jgi:putative chitinase
MPLNFELLDSLDIISEIDNITGPITAAVDTAVAAYSLSPVTLDAINQAQAAGELAASVGETITDLACGQEGIFTKIKQIQTFAQQKVMLGRNFYNSVIDTIDQVQLIIDQLSEPDLLISLLQQEALNIVSQSILNNPNSSNALATIAELRAKYQEAGPAAQQVIDNLQLFIEDPLNNPLDVCNSIPNLIKIGETFVEFPKKALQADPSKTLESIQEVIVKEYLNIFDNPATKGEATLNDTSEQDIRTIPKYPTPDIMNDIIIAGRVPIDQAYSLGPGSANKAALNHTNTNEKRNASINKSTPPNIPTISNPYPEGEQYVASDFALSKNAKNIASKLNGMHPSVRKNYAEGIKSFLNANTGFDINLSEGYRSPYGSANITGGLSPIQISAVRALQEKGINDPVEVSNILAQIQAESGFRPRSEEVGAYSAQKLFEFYGNQQSRNKVRFQSIAEAQALKARGPEAVGNLLYGGRLGNSPNEGFKYRGRGLIQLTGKYNYELYSKKVGVDLVSNPDLANDQEVASKIAVEYFLSKQQSGTDLKDIASVGRAVGYAGGASETNSRAKISQDFQKKLAQNGYDNLPAGDSWHNFGAAADVIVYENSKPVPPEANPTMYFGELRTALSAQGLSNDKAAEPSHFYVSSLGSEVPEDVKSGKVSFNKFIGGTARIPTSVASSTGTTTRYDISSIQRAARDKAISDALAQGKSAREADSIGNAVGNTAGAEALRNIV